VANVRVAAVRVAAVRVAAVRVAAVRIKVSDIITPFISTSDLCSFKPSEKLKCKIAQQQPKTQQTQPGNPNPDTQESQPIHLSEPRNPSTNIEGNIA
jgi:hypothetical protein